MRLMRTTILGGALLLAAGTAAAAAEKAHQMKVALPDGSVAQIEYVGDVAPTVTVQPLDARVAVADPFAEFDRIAQIMDAQRQALMQQVAQMQQAAAEAASRAPGALPAGIHYSYVSSTTDAKGCTRTVEYSSDGVSAAPKVTRASSGTCDSVKPQGPVPASAASPSSESSAHRV